MDNAEINEKIKSDGYKGEKIINRFRFAIALLYVLVVVLFAILRNIEGLEPFPRYGFIPNSVFLLYSVVLFFTCKKMIIFIQCLNIFA